MKKSSTKKTVRCIETFLNQHVIQKDSDLDITHTQFSQFQNRKFHISENDYPEFISLYNNNIIKTKKNHSIVERQLIHKNGGPGVLLSDFDFQFSELHKDRQYTTDHKEQIINWYLEEISNTFELDEDVTFLVTLMEKPSPRVITKPTGAIIVKDGLHLVCSVMIDPIYHQYIRSNILKKITENWNELPVINKWEDVLDNSIANGTNGWLAPQSKKKDDSSFYVPSISYNVQYDNDSAKWKKHVLLTDSNNVESFYSQYHKHLFIRNKEMPKLSLLRDDAESKIEEFKSRNSKPSQHVVTNPTPLMQGGGDEEYQIPVSTIRQIKNKEDAMTCLDVFLDTLPSHKYDLREAYEYTMALTSDYYDSGSYNKWIKVGFALRNTNIYLLIVWLVFSSQSSTFQWSTDVGSICDFWMKFIHHPEGGVTKQSLMYWCRNENPERFQSIREKTVDYYLDQSVESLTLEQLTAKGKNKGSCDYDIATVVYHFKNGLFVSCGIRNNEWYSFNGSYWQRDDSGTTLRHILSLEVRGLYAMKAKKLCDKAHSIKTADGAVDVDNEEHILLKARATVLLSIASRLGNTHDKDNIMRECRELFYDKEFEKKLDQNRYLMGFKNGVIDFKEKRFRKGIPEDYISKCTQRDFIPLDSNKHSTIVNEIKEYFHELFPLEEVYNYMWNHMASMLIGDSAKVQCLHYYIGIGQNGKSMMVKLLELIFGDYAVPLDASFFIKDRPGRGAATPDIAKLPGTRLAVTSEPTEGGKPVCLYEGPMKQLTSGTDKIPYRSMYKDQDYFVPQCHSIIQSNDFIPIKSRDHGTWRRIRVVRFISLFTDNPVSDDPDKPYQFLKKDNFEQKFEIWADIFMSMLVEIAYKMQGSLPICKEIQRESDDYRRKQDFIAEFMDEHLVAAEPDERLKKTELIVKFNAWYQEQNGVKITGKTQEIYNIMEKKYGVYRQHPRPGWAGVALRKAYDDEDDTTIESV